MDGGLIIESAQQRRADLWVCVVSFMFYTYGTLVIAVNFEFTVS